MLKFKQDKCENVFKYKELVLYAIFGCLTTVLNIVVYFILTHIFIFNFMFSNALAWMIAFIFAYYTNSKFVFSYLPFFSEGCLRRFIKFFNSRIFTGVLDMFLMWFFVGDLKINDSISKFVVNVIVIILNYVMSKFLIFKGEE